MSEYREHYDTFEDYKNSVRNAELNFWLQRLESAEWSIVHLDIDHIHIEYGQEQTGTIADGTVRTDGWTFFLQTQGTRARTNGTMLAPDTAFVVAPGDRFYIATMDAHEWFSVFVPNGLLLEDSRHIADSGTLDRDSRVIDIPPDDLENVRTFSDNVQGTQLQRNAIQQERVVTTARRWLRLPGRYPRRPGRRPTDRTVLLARVTAAIEQAPSMNPDLPALLDAVGVSERTLRNAFQEFFGIAPKDFIVLRRLHECRRLLRDAASHPTDVTTVASTFAFWDFGRFATRYRNVFGECPSETLARHSPSS